MKTQYFIRTINDLGSEFFFAIEPSSSGGYPWMTKNISSAHAFGTIEKALEVIHREFVVECHYAGSIYPKTCAQDATELQHYRTAGALTVQIVQMIPTVIQTPLREVYEIKYASAEERLRAAALDKLSAEERKALGL